MSKCPNCQAELSPADLRRGKCPKCGNASGRQTASSGSSATLDFGSIPNSREVSPTVDGGSKADRPDQTLDLGLPGGWQEARAASSAAASPSAQPNLASPTAPPVSPSRVRKRPG